MVNQSPYNAHSLLAQPPAQLLPAHLLPYPAPTAVAAELVLLVLGSAGNLNSRPTAAVLSWPLSCVGPATNHFQTRSDTGMSTKHSSCSIYLTSCSDGIGPSFLTPLAINSFLKPASSSSSTSTSEDGTCWPFPRSLMTAARVAAVLVSHTKRVSITTHVGTFGYHQRRLHWPAYFCVNDLHAGHSPTDQTANEIHTGMFCLV
jgi:hypothetical protein